MESVILAALIRSWHDKLVDEIDRLNIELPIEHQTQTRYVRKHSPAIFDAGFKINMHRSPSPETDPELYDQVTDILPLSELDNLRELAHDLDSFAEQLDLLLPPSNNYAKGKTLVDVFSEAKNYAA